VIEDIVIALAIYLAIGMVWAGTLLAAVQRRAKPSMGDDRIANWIASAILFVRWTCSWLPTLLYYWFTAD
jgi:hypothetical protein